MATKTELQERIAELEAALARAEVLNQISRSLSLARDEDELVQILAWLTLAATRVNCPGHSGHWTIPIAC